MNEKYLHYIWQYRLFNQKQLKTQSGENLIIHKQGYENQLNGGPDFTDAVIELDGQLWAGTVEIHLKSSDWYVHHHETDKNYDNVILHVVWDDDTVVYSANQQPVTTLILKGLVPQSYLENYQKINQNNISFIPCENVINHLNPMLWFHFSERLYIERLQRKSEEIKTLLQSHQNDWEWVSMMLLFKTFGVKYNADAFLSVAQQLNFKIVWKESNQLQNLEALFLGVSGLLSNDYQDNYYQQLQKIYRYQKHKYQLKEILQSPQFFRLRPPNFPTIRLAQLAQIFYQNNSFFQTLITAKNLQEIYQLLQVNTSAYWETHYVFDKPHKKQNKTVSTPLLHLIVINAVIPLQFVYQQYQMVHKPEQYFTWLTELPAEKNNIVERFQQVGLRVENSLQSQAVLTLKQDYCNLKKCLSCEIGNYVIKNQ